MKKPKLKQPLKTVGHHTTRALKKAHHVVAQKPHDYLTIKYDWYRKWHEQSYHKYVHYAIVVVYVISFSLILGIVQHGHASGSNWTQTDWSGGVGTSTTNQYSASSSVTTSTTNHITLSPNSEKFSNTGFETDTSSWPASDPNFANVVTLIHADGANNSTSFSDTSPKAKTITVGGDTKVSTAQSKFGGASATFDGAGDYLSMASSSDLGFSGDFTIEGWFYANSFASTGYYKRLWSEGNDTGNSLVMNVQTNGELDFRINDTQEITTSANALTTGTWYHIALSRSSGQMKMFINGTQVGSTYSSNADLSSYDAYPFYIGIMGQQSVTASGTNSAWNGYIDDFRITKGTGDYTSNFTAPTSALSDFGLIRSTSVHHTGSAAGQVVAGSTAANITQSINVGDTNKYNLVAYAYIDGTTAVDNTYAQLLVNGSTVSTTYASAGGGWYKLSAIVTGTASSQTYGVQVKALKTVYLDDASLNNYQTSGSLTSAIYDMTIPSNFGNLSYSVTTPTNTTATVLVRAGNNANLSDAPAFTSCSAVGSGSAITSTCAPNISRYVQYKINFTSDGSAQPDFTSVTIPYSPSDITAPPTNASAITGFHSSGGASLASNAWANASPYFSWTAGADNGGGTGIAGYCLYVGQDSTGDPVTTKGLLGASPLNTNSACQFAVSSTSVDLSTNGYLATALTTSNSPYYLNIKAVDGAGNVYSGSSAQFQFRFDNTAPSNPTFISAPSQFVASKDVTLTWPTSGGDAASDSNSGVAGLQYKIGSSSTWYGDSHTGSASDLLANDGSYETTTVPDYANLSEGNNIVSFRTVDAAGNISSAFVTTVIKLNTSSPSSPQNVTATPSSNTTNSFAFSWLAPATFTGSASNITYCYSINSVPTSNNCTFTAAGVTSLSAGAYATQPGDNTFYVVAKDEAGNINYATQASTTFTANTSAPGVPLNAEIADVSNKDTASWKLAISWSQPSDVGTGINSYKVYRSTDNSNFSQVASTAGISYVDTGLSQQTYYYKIKACDSANNCGAFSSTVSQLPSGKFTSPATIISQPSVTVSTRTATINWATDRASDSRIQYGTSSGNYFATEASNSSQVTSHSIQLTNLSAGTTYYYKAKWGDIDGNVGNTTELIFTTQPAPFISDVKVLSTSLSSATIQFTSQDAIQVKLFYGPNDSFGGLKTINTSASKSTYTVELDGLSDGTDYSFKLNTIDSDNNEYPGNQANKFTTPPRPRITNLTFQPVAGQPTSTQKISWDTNVAATSLVRFTAASVPDTEKVDSNFVTHHELTINNLLDDTEYTLTAQSTDQGGNIAISDPNVFHTALDTRPPQISGTNVETSIRGNGADARGQLIVSWKTDEAATSQVAYGEGSSGSGYTSKTSEDDHLTFDHVVIVSDLAPSKVYHLQPLSKDKAGNLQKGTDQSAIIGQATDNVLTIILNSLQKVFGL